MRRPSMQFLEKKGRCSLQLVRFFEGVFVFTYPFLPQYFYFFSALQLKVIVSCDFFYFHFCYFTFGDLLQDRG